jgi:Galactose oxidase, central domain
VGRQAVLIATIVIALGASAGCAGKEPAKEPTGPGWSATGSLLAARNGHSATLLRDGRVLVAGGTGADSRPLSSAELYDPNAGAWTSTGSMVAPLSSARATLLSDGRVLVIGMTGERPGAITAGLYVPLTGTWSEAGDTTTLRQDYTMTPLADGRVLVAGGLDPTTDKSLASAEIFDPATGTWSPTGTMGTARCGHTATLLRDGRVLVAGDLCGAVAAGAGDSGGAAAAAATPTATGSQGSRATNVPSVPGPAAPLLASAEVYDPSTGKWSLAGGPTAPRRAAAATLLADGRVFVLTLTPLGAVQIFDPGAGRWHPAGTVRGWMSPTAILLADGRVVVTSFRELEIYDPRTEASLSIQTGDATDSGYSATLLADGRVLLAGGYALLSSGGFAPVGEVLGLAHLYRP